MTDIREVARIGNVAWGVTFVVCRNAEVAGLALELDDHDDALHMMDSAGRAISDAGFDYEWCGDFRAYNGGPLTGLVDAIYYVANVVETEGEVDELDNWSKVWERGAGATVIPAIVRAKVEEVIEVANAAIK